MSPATYELLLAKTGLRPIEPPPASDTDPKVTTMRGGQHEPKCGAVARGVERKRALERRLHWRGAGHPRLCRVHLQSAESPRQRDKKRKA